MCVKVEIEDFIDNWDNISEKRYVLTKQGEDISFDYVLKPCILQLVESLNCTTILDAGCGTGILTKILSNISDSIVGIDINKKSIDIALTCEYSSNLKYYNISIENFSKSYHERFSICVSNMVLMDTLKYDEIIKSIYDLIIENGYFIFTITHPCFWPIYKKYHNKIWFKYNEEIAIRSTFKLSKSDDLGEFIHFHRPLEAYVDVLNKVRFSVKRIIEPYPQNVPATVKNYSFDYPRFLCIVAKK
jgi:SAM-dependent methyltransferase